VQGALLHAAILPARLEQRNCPLRARNAAGASRPASKAALLGSGGL
jgi:hypothetical protein